jgi:GTP-binding protein LepA
MAHPAAAPLAGYSDPKPMVFCGLFPIDADDFEVLRESLQKLKLNDASISYLPESSGALGFGFRCGFLGLLHMEIVKERLEREFNLALIATAPSVQYRVLRTNGDVEVVDNPSDLPATVNIDEIEEPFFKLSIITPKDYTGALMELCQTRRGEMTKLEYLSPERVEMQYLVPLAEVVVDFFDQMKSKSQGYASLDYELHGYRTSDLVRVDILLNGIPADAFSMIVHRDKATDYGRRMCEKLKTLIPRQMFDIPIQAAIGGKVISRETVKAKRKDVLAKCYGGDISRKRKLLDKQKEGKKKMKAIGRVEVPGDVFITALKLDD